MVRHYDDFITELCQAGFSMGGGNSEGIFAVVPWRWNDAPPYDTPVRWHTGDRETDPWEWRMRVLDERNDIAYAKLFFKKSGYITQMWYPYFWAARRGNRSFAQAYADGSVSHNALRLYEVIDQNDVLPVHAMKPLAGFGKEDKAAFERALTELQMKLYITMCGRQQKLSAKGEEYGWSSTVFCKTESFWGAEMAQKAAGLSPDEAAQAIAAQILKLNPEAPQKKIKAFIQG